MGTTQTKNKRTIFTDRVRGWVSGILTPLGNILYRLGVHPDMVTIFGLAVVAIGAIVIGRGMFHIGGLILLVALPLDAVDGAVARAMERKGKFGAILDSAMDRYADGFIFAALSYYFAGHDQLNMMLISQAALLGSLLVSYVRARAGGVRVDTKIGYFSRLERVIVIIVMLFVPSLLNWGVILLAIGTHITVIQRLWFVYDTLKDRGDS